MIIKLENKHITQKEWPYCWKELLYLHSYKYNCSYISLHFSWIVGLMSLVQVPSVQLFDCCIHKKQKLMSNMNIILNNLQIIFCEVTEIDLPNIFIHGHFLVNIFY